MPVGKQGKNIIATVEVALKRCNEFMSIANEADAALFKDSALRLALELNKYGEYIKTTLLMDAASTASPREPAKRRLTQQDLVSLQGASDEERAAVERTPPEGAGL